jgi:hypothetical protein
MDYIKPSQKAKCFLAAKTAHSSGFYTDFDILLKQIFFI